MGRLLTITATGQSRAGIRKRTLRRDALKVGPVSVQLVVIVVGTLLGLFYLVQSNRVSTQNLQLKAIETQKAQVVEDNERLSVEAARLQSIQQIKKSAAESNPAPATKPVASASAAGAQAEKAPKASAASAKGTTQAAANTSVTE